MTKKYKTIIIIISILLIASISIGAIYLTRDKEKEIVIENVDAISKYNYTLKKNDSITKKNKFKELKEILEKDILDEDAYAKTLAEIFVIDVYDLNSKISKYDIGGLEYIYESDKDKFKNIMLDTLYNSVEDNALDNRKQKLPIVVNVTSDNITQSEYKINDTTYSSWNIQIKIDYETDLGYDKNVLVTVIKDTDKLYVVEIKPI